VLDLSEAVSQSRWLALLRLLLVSNLTSYLDHHNTNTFKPPPLPLPELLELPELPELLELLELLELVPRLQLVSHSQNFLIFKLLTRLSRCRFRSRRSAPSCCRNCYRTPASR
jgi:hypothetical protein